MFTLTTFKEIRIKVKNGDCDLNFRGNLIVILFKFIFENNNH